MTTIEELRKAVNQFNNAIYYAGGNHQFIIDFAEHLYDKVNASATDVDVETLIGSIRYEVNNVVEVLRTDIPDYEHIVELQKQLQS
jgi:hypothetical protein